MERRTKTRRGGGAAPPGRAPRSRRRAGPPLEIEKLRAYQEWAAARLFNGEDPRDAAAFCEHLRALGANWRVPYAYGLPAPRPGPAPAAEPPDPARVREYRDWAAARLLNGQDPRDARAFVEHLHALGADWRAPHAYGLPFPLPRPSAGPFLVRPDLDFSGPPGPCGSRPGHFQVIDEGAAEWHDDLVQFRQNYFDNCGPIAMAHVVNAVRWRHNDPRTLNAGEAIRLTRPALAQPVRLRTADGLQPEWVVHRGTVPYDGDQTLDVFALAAVAKRQTGVEMVVRSTRPDVPGEPLGFDEALALARTRPIVVNKPGHISTVVADKGGKSILWLMQGWIGARFNGDGGALTGANWHEWNWQCWYPAEPLWGVPGLDEEADMALVEELQARNARLEEMIADREARLADLVNRCGYVAGDLADIATRVGEQLREAVTELDHPTARGAIVKARVEEIVRDSLMPVVTALRAQQPPSS
jgi:hypothetical protein